MKPIEPGKRRVANVDKGGFQTLYDKNGRADGEVLQINADKKLGYGFHIYRMPPGHTTTPHEHQGDEEFLVLEGELIDHDGFRYKRGDLVWLAAKTRHSSYSPDGALLAVYFR